MKRLLRSQSGQRVTSIELELFIFAIPALGLLFFDYPPSSFTRTR